MSQVVFLPNTSQKISMREKSLLLNNSLASKDNITLAGDFCHGKDGMNFFLFFLFCQNLKLHFSFWLWCLLNIGLWQHDREKKQRVPPLTYSPSLFSLVRLSFLDTWLIVTAVYWGYFIWKRIHQWNVNELDFFFFFFTSCFFITGQQFWTFFKVTRPNSTVCNELIIPAMSLKSHAFFNQCAWNRSFLKGILFSLSIGTIRNLASIKCALINRCVAPWSAGFSVVLHLWLNISFMRFKMTQS